MDGELKEGAKERENEVSGGISWYFSDFFGVLVRQVFDSENWLITFNDTNTFLHPKTEHCLFFSVGPITSSHALQSAVGIFHHSSKTRIRNHIKLSVAGVGIH